MPAQRCIEVDVVDMMASSITDGGNNTKYIRFDNDEEPVTNTSFDGRTGGIWDNEW